MWPSPPAPITTAFVPAPSTGIAFLTAWMAVSPASASAAIEAGSSDGSSLTTERALVSSSSAKPPSRLMPGNEPLTQCMSSPRRHGVHSPQEMNGCTITVSPTSTLVTPEPISWTQPAFSWPGRVGQDDLGLLGPLALLDVQVGAAQPRGADLHDDVERPGRLGLVDRVELERLVVLVQPCRVHAATSSGSLMS